MEMNEALIEYVLKKIKPSEKDIKEVNSLASKIINECKEKCIKNNLETEVILSGSTAKNTWLKNLGEIDVFVLFNKSLGEKEIEEYIIKIGKEVIKDLNGTYRLRYAEHPYVEGFIDKYRVNIVAAYKVPKGEWKSSADRTPYHTEYVNSKINDYLRDQIRILKAFLIGCKLYGAEIRIGGFSGYLAELLIINFGSFMKVIEEVAKWKPQVYIDIEKLLNEKEAFKKFPYNPLIVIDPVDKNRNVAAAVTKTKFSEFIISSKLFLKNPSKKFFFQKKYKPRTIKQIIKEIKKEERNILAISFIDKEIKPPDILWGELLKTLNGIEKLMNREGFKVIKCDAWSNNKECLLLYELQTLQLPRNYKHIGPPVYIKNALDFIEKNLKNKDTISGPWIKGYRIYVEKKRNIQNAREFLIEKIKRNEVSIAKRLLPKILRGEIIEGIGIAKLCKNIEIREFIDNFLKGRVPYI
ncbi:MAG: CCA tRNA nucleotidyltransferase [Nitrososphaerota archaeon]